MAHIGEEDMELRGGEGGGREGGVEERQKGEGGWMEGEKRGWKRDRKGRESGQRERG